MPRRAKSNKPLPAKTVAAISQATRAANESVNHDLCPNDGARLLRFADPPRHLECPECGFSVALLFPQQPDTRAGYYRHVSPPKGIKVRDSW